MNALIVAAAYVWTEIVVPGATVVQAFGLNDKGQTAVTTTDGTSGIYQNGTFTPLPAPPPGYQVAAIGINNSGVITGSATTTTNPNEPGFVLVGSVYTFFSRPGFDTTLPRHIANSGLITGESYGSPTIPASTGFIYDPATNTFTDATPPGSTATITQGMNKFGRITGDGVEPGIGRYGFVWQQESVTKGNRELLPFLDRIKIDVITTTRGINDSGVVVGRITDATGRTFGFVGSAARGYQRLVAPGGAMSGNSTFCQGINNFAQVVCSVTDSAINPLGSFIGTPSDE